MKMQKVDELLNLAKESGLSLEMDYSGPVLLSPDSSVEWTQGDVLIGRCNEGAYPGWEYHSDKQGRSLKNPRFIDDEGECFSESQVRERLSGVTR